MPYCFTCALAADSVSAVEKPSIFVSYSRKDVKFVGELKTQLLSLRDSFELELWDDSQIPVGKSFRDRIVVALERATIGILLISPDFLGSDFINDVELPELLGAAERNALTLCLVHVRESLVDQHARLGTLQSVNDPARPLKKLRKAQRDREWLAISRKILAVARQRAKATEAADHASAYQQLASKLRRYCLKAMNLKSAFELVGRSAQESEGDLEELNLEIRRYNDVAEDLLVNGNDYVLRAVKELPGELRSEVEGLLAFAVDELHRSYAFQLNEARITFTHLRRGEVPADEISAVSQRLQREIQPYVRGLDDKVPVLERRIDRLSERIAGL